MIYDCIIVGAGISGLSAAAALQARGANLLVVEAGATPGGAMQSTIRDDGYVLDNGPNTVTSNNAALWQHFAELGIADARIVAGHSGKNRYVLRDGKPAALPLSPPAFVRSSLLSPAAKLRLMLEPLLPRSPMPDESVFSFFARRLGLEPAQRMIDPFVSGVYAGDPRALSVKAAFGSLWDAEQRAGSIVLGMLTARKAQSEAPKPKQRAKRELFNFTNGLATWPQAIADRLGERLWLNAPATGLQPADYGWRLTVRRNGHEEVLHASQVVLAAPAFVAADLVAGVDTAAAAALQAIPYPPMAVVHLAFPRENIAHPLDGFGVLCPSEEGRNVLGILWNSTLFAGRAPAGVALTTSFVGGARTPEIALQDDELLTSLVVREHVTMLGAQGQPVMVHISRWPRAIPQYVAGHDERIATLEQLEAAWPGLHLIGNYRGGVSAEKCWQNGLDLGNRLALGVPTEAAAATPA